MGECAWVTTLTGDTGYLKGIITLNYTLRHVNSGSLKTIGCRIKKVQAIRPAGHITYSQKRFRDTWTKLTAWDQEDTYDRLVLLDADMLPLQNMDALMTIPFPQTYWVAACPACTCNPQQMKNYPRDWVPNKCAYTYADNMIEKDDGYSSSHSQDADHLSTQKDQHLDYFNSGLVVLNPRHDVFQQMLQRLHDTTATELNKYTFPDQDFLNEEFEKKWTVLPYHFNALKPMVVGHPSLWNINDIHNIHYILAKPWNVDWSDTSKENPKYYPLYQLWRDCYHNALAYYNISVDIDSLIESA
ncbi:unnamed protein product [Absidia cylindrospora]